VVIDCTRIEAARFEVDLFGYAKGAFTGACADRAGIIEMADNGVLVLEHCDSLDAQSQSKMLRLIEFGEIAPLGKAIRRCSFSLISTSSRSLLYEASQGSMRYDLVQRLAGLCVGLLPLRKNRTTLWRVVRAVLRSVGMDGVGFSPAGQERILDYEWPGNFREVQSFCERLRVRGKHGMLSAEEVQLALGPGCLPDKESQG